MFIVLGCKNAAYGWKNLKYTFMYNIKVEKLVARTLLGTSKSNIFFGGVIFTMVRARSRFISLCVLILNRFRMFK